DLRDEMIRALQFRGAARCELGDDGGLEDLREAIRLGEEAGLGQALALARGNYAYQLWFRDGPAAALVVWEEMQRAAERHGFDGLAHTARMGQLETLFDLGRWDEVLATCDEIERWLSPDDRRTELAIYATTFETWVHLRRGEMHGLVETADDLLDRATPFAQSEIVAPATLLAAECRRNAGDVEGARAALRAFADITQTVPNFRALFVPVAARALVALGDIDEAERMIPDHSDASTARHRVSLLTARSIVTEARGRCGDALATYLEAVALWRAHGFRLELGLTLVGMGRCLLKLDREEEGHAVFSEAREVLRPLHARPALDEVDELLHVAVHETGA
ncbi:MAG: hypothetical protein ACXVEI_07365, partial [Actinomycetota bacterium]